MEKELREGIIALIPKYIDQKGNCTMIYTRVSKPRLIEKSIKTVIKNIGKFYMIDLGEIKKRYVPLISSPNLMPIPLSKKDIFIPIKTRKPIIKNDGAFGYVNINYIKEIKKDKNNTKIHLVNGTILECLSSINTVEKHIRNGNIISYCYEERSMKIAEEESKYMAVFHKI